jgi:hypothetical protein
VILLFHAPIPQDPAYHNFADQHTILGIPRFGDVITNLGFNLVGLLGLWFLWRKTDPNLFQNSKEQSAYTVFFLGLFLTGLGSAYYHLEPNSSRLFWDRLPVTLTFMSMLSIVITERASPLLGIRLLLPLLLVGAGSVVYWHLGEQAGNGDLRFYGIVQFYPMLAIPLMLILFRSRYVYGAYFWGVIGWYALAKICELLDVQVLDLAGIISGHNLKHIFASIGAWCIVRMLKQRGRLQSDSDTRSPICQSP